MASVTADRLAALHALDDQALARSARTGDADAFGILVERYHHGLWHFLVRRIHNDELAEDLTQETFTDAFQHLGRYDHQRSFRAWLFGIALHHMQMQWRRQRARHVLSLEWLTEKAAPPPALWQDDRGGSFQVQELINAVFAEMSVPLREVLLLNCEQGFTALEIAQTLGISQSAAERRLSRAKQQFREAYVRLNGEAPC